jgi:hypothetical protein
MRPALLLILLAAGARAAEPARPPTRWGVGASVVGAQARYFFTPRWAAEARYMTGTVGSGPDSATSQVAGLRGYRFFETGSAYRFYLGGETAAFSGGDHYQGLFYRAVGVAAGAFGGAEYFLGRRWAVSLDAGPYLLSIKERTTQTQDTSFDFILNAAVNLYFF